MRLKQLAQFSFKSEAVWLLLFPLVITCVGVLIAVLVILFRKFAV